VRLTSNTTLFLMLSAGALQAQAPRSSAALVHDAQSGALLLYGGYAVQGAPPDERAVVWQRATGNWQSIAPVGRDSPGVRSDMVVVFDSAGGRMLLVGGQAGDSAFGDVWSWQNGDWRRITDGGPGGRHLVAGAFDPIRNELVLMGGHDLNANLMRHDTWVFGANGWRAADTSHTLGQRFAAGMAWDPARRAIVLHGGHKVEGGVQGDTWQWTGNGWQRITLNGPTIPAHNSLVADPLGRGLLLISSPGDPVREPMETWLLEGTAWRRLTVGGPSPRGGHALVHDPATRRVWLFGGERDSRTKFNDLWQFDGERWAQVTP
jgi:hypothetical protein